MRHLTFLLAMGLGGVAFAGPPVVRVSLYSKYRPHQVWVERRGGMRITLVAEDGRRRVARAARIQVRCGGRAPVEVEGSGKKLAGASVEIRSANDAEAILRTGVPGGPARLYQGWLEVLERNRGCLIVNHVGLDPYSRQVACGEIRGAGPEALRAQAVVARSYALATLGKHAEQGFDFCDLSHCQVYTGQQACTRRQRKSLAAVDGLALLHEGKPAETYYFSTCGGHTAASGDVWGPRAARPYLTGVADGRPPHCAASPHLRWRLEVGQRELCRRLRGAMPQLGDGPCRIRVAERGAGGWVRRVEVRAEQPVWLPGDRFHLMMGRLYGWARFKSARFTCVRDGGTITFRGRGMGHGVGMCQHGAMGMERAGADHRAILRHYFPRCELGSWP